MRNAQAAVKFALEEEGVADPAKVARKVLKRLAAHRPLVVAWLCEVEGLRFIGYTSRRTPKRIHEVPFTRDDCHVYLSDDCEDPA